MNDFAGSTPAEGAGTDTGADSPLLGAGSPLDDRQRAVIARVTAAERAGILAPHRGSGAQTALLRAFHAALATRDLGRRGVKLAAATAAPGSPSLRNMACAGFAVHPRRAWRSRLSE
ncbi:hypothetical protein [Nakamurella sp. PAMC28650]|uniref:hypothetical protein n=1 Tax=Nakamurella sp. PAMC28650 TaxID=2762325 RepID=UPI00164E52EA|nr:hypothetical protein [Nakamurella sp. PAMC28650]QNK83305.1 hypothetical protein H7F38_12065 [Nakamurella sp. PAMC28650]